MSSKKKKRKGFKKKKVIRTFAPIYPARMGTPKAAGMGGAVPVTSGPFPLSPATAGVPGMQVSDKQFNKNPIEELKRIFSKKEESSNAAWTGYSGPHALQVFNVPNSEYQSNNPSSGRYDWKKSPGVGFKTEYGWRVWEAALDIMAKEKTLSKSAILLAAFSKAGIPLNKVDPSEVRLIDMAIEWYLSDTGAVSAKRDGQTYVSNGFSLGFR